MEVPTDATSLVIGNEDYSNINYNFTVSAADYYEVGELAWASAIPTLSSLNDANVSNIVVTASLPDTPDANTLYLIPEA